MPINVQYYNETLKSFENFDECISYDDGECSYNTIEFLECRYNKLISLPKRLPSLLVALHCDYNNLTSLPENLPASLQNLDCENNNLTSLPKISATSLQL